MSVIRSFASYHAPYMVHRRLLLRFMTLSLSAGSRGFPITASFANATSDRRTFLIYTPACPLSGDSMVMPLRALLATTGRQVWQSTLGLDLTTALITLPASYAPQPNHSGPYSISRSLLLLSAELLRRPALHHGRRAPS